MTRGVRKGSRIDETGQAVAELLEQQRKEELLERRLALVQSYGEDGFDDGQRLTFTKYFDSTGDKPFRYVAIKCDGSWYVSSRHEANMTWDEFVLWLTNGDRPVVPEVVYLLRIDRAITNVNGVST